MSDDDMVRGPTPVNSEGPLLNTKDGWFLYDPETGTSTPSEPEWPEGFIYGNTASWVAEPVGDDEAGE